MVRICQDHAIQNDLMFSSDPDPIKSKTVCIAFNCQNKETLQDIYLDGNKLPWKSSAKHIGNYLNEDGTMNTDVKTKRAQFINTCMNQNDEFECLDTNYSIFIMHILQDHLCGTCNQKMSINY